MAHMDELSMLVKRIETDGTLHMTQLGTMYPGNFGFGPVAVLGDAQTLTGVLTLGSEHTTKESPRIWETKPDKGDRALDWQHVYVFTGRTPDDLAAAGVHAGTRVCVDRSKRDLVEFGDYIGCYFLDDRAAVTALLGAARRLHERGQRPPEDVYLVFTTNEEIGGVGGTYASATLPGTLTIALEVGPTEREYGTTVTGGPIVGYSDATLRVRQGRRRSPDEDRDRSRTLAPGCGAGRLRIRRLALQGKRVDPTCGTALPAHAEHPWLRSHSACRDRRHGRDRGGLFVG